MRAAAVFSALLGAAGMYFLAGLLGAGRSGRVIAGIIFALGSVNVLEMVEGHVNVFNAMWLPWIFAAWLMAYRGKWRPLITGVFAAAAFYGGGIYLLFYVGFAFVLLTLLSSRKLRALKASASAVVWAAGFSAFKLLPVAMWLREFPDASYAASANTLNWLGDILFGRYLHGAEVIMGQGSGWHEYGAYVGAAAAIMAIFGLVLAKNRKQSVLLAGALFSAALLSASGQVLKPFFDAFPYIPRSNISRLIIFTVIGISLLSGLGVSRLRAKGAAGKIAALLLMFFAVSELATLSAQLSRQAFVLPRVEDTIETARAPIEFTNRPLMAEHGGSNYSRSYEALLAGYGPLSFPSVLGPYPQVDSIEGEREGYAVFEGGRAGSIKIADWTPNRVVLDIEAERNAAVRINSNYAPGWRANDEPAENIGGKVGKTVAEGSTRIVFRFVPEGAAAGAAVTGAAIIFALGGMVVSARSGKRGPTSA